MTKFSKKDIKVIDLFAGPGGLGEGFSSCQDSRFEIAMSVEKEPNAHETLRLRSFYRKLDDKALYYQYVKSSDESEKVSNRNTMIAAHKEEWDEATYETMGSPCALGNSIVFEKWQNGEVPTEGDFLLETEAQRYIKERINEVKKSTGRAHGRKISDSTPLVIIGGPPCQAYSTMGRGRRAGIVDHNQDHDQRFFLYKEYAEVIDQALPDIFVMENVSGIGSAKLADDSLILPKIIERLEYLKEDASEIDRKKYHIYSLVTDKSKFIGTKNIPSDKDYLIKAINFGVPQDRRRVILLGIRADRDTEEISRMIMTPGSHTIAPSVGETISSLPNIRSSISNRSRNISNSASLADTDTNWHILRKKSLEMIRHLVSGKSAIRKGVEDIIYWDTMCVRLTKAKQMKPLPDITIGFLETIPLTLIELDTIEKNRVKYEELVRTVYPRIEYKIEELMLEVEHSLPLGSDFYLRARKRKTLNPRSGAKYLELEQWLQGGINGALNHSAKQHMPEDITRYIFSALWTEVEKMSPVPEKERSPAPLTKFFPRELASKHKSWYTKNFQDRFRTYPDTYRAKTITAHMHKDGHANIHFDPLQARSLTVREAARIQTFPDDYYFEGGQSAQYKQVGNAVPPFLAKQIAEHVLDIIAKFH